MRILYQPTESTPQDWRSIQASDWARLDPLTCHAVCVQGMTFDGADHYSVEVVDRCTIRVVVWYNDPGDWPTGQRWARVWEFCHLKPSTDPLYGGAIRPEHKQIIYCEDGIGSILKAAYGRNPSISFQPWSAFDPRRVNAMPGKWVTDEQHAEQQAKQSVQGWRTWTEGLDPGELDAHGCVQCQRAVGRYEIPKGTRTYYHNDVILDGAVHANTPNFEHEFGISPGGVGTATANIGVAGEEHSQVTTPANEPNSAAWPTTGVYRHQIDVTAAGVDLAFGMLDLGSGTGHFARVNAAIDTELQSFQQDQSAFSGSGLHLASITDPAWSAGSATDRFEALIAAQKIVGHGNQSLTLQIGETDDFADGPWAAAVAAADNTIFFGTNF